MEIKYPVYQPLLNGNEKKYVTDCLETGWISSKGAYIQRFEESFATYTQARYATSACNGTAAVLLALLALGIGPGDEVIVPSLVYVAVPNMVRFAGASPVFVDCLSDTFQMDPTDIRKKISLRTKAVVAVHTYGHPCDMEAISKICKTHDLKLIEDCAEALGARFQGKQPGSWGDMAVYSFFGNKTLTTGEGGMITSNSSSLIKKAFHLKNQGVTEKAYWHDIPAFNFRMTNISAAIGLAQLESIDEVIEKKRRIASVYRQQFMDSGIIFHQEAKDVIHSYWMCSILAPEGYYRDSLRVYLSSEGIETRPFFYPAHTLPFYKNSHKQRLPVTEEISSRGINLPSYPALRDEDVRHIASRVLTFIRKQTGKS